MSMTFQRRSVLLTAGLFGGILCLSALARTVLAARAFRSDLLLNPMAPTPRYQDLRRIERTVILKYRVGANESLYSLWRRHKFDITTVRSSNDLEIPTLEPGSIIRIPNHRGTLYEVKDPENLVTISRGFEQGRRLGAAYDRQILLSNNYPMPDLNLKDYPFRPGTVLFLPKAFKPMGPTLPFVQGMGRRTSSFGRRRSPTTGASRSHKGLDIAKPYGSTVVTAAPGVVTYAGWMGGYGNMVEIRHSRRKGPGYYTRYGHLSRISVRPGQRVGLYKKIGEVGSTGISTGPHLHFEYRDESGRPRNPDAYL